MNQKLQTRAIEQVAHMLQPGEVAILATRAMVGTFDSGRFGAVAREGLLNAGVGSVATRRLLQAKKQFIIVTNRRLIFIPQGFLGRPGKEILSDVPREIVSLAEFKTGVVSLVRIAFGTQGEGLALTFPRVDKKNAEALAQALQQAPVA
ncbi:hypothetical protein GCM10010172_76680 [Paractinoplanes ferrugineus]|uniref:YokE-like PH domain-containing protein n=1 Tax=Paractinoplanes ferrugineus TaxID=113564 RepID=A0A919ME27_9ACTN|nr:hypothetical protein [Actinoplanes ferrugineus]GIE16426.1 hypothetical protein Afe05nite_82660 [Actinoplanes ferrugineus]